MLWQLKIRKQRCVQEVKSLHDHSCQVWVLFFSKGESFPLQKVLAHLGVLTCGSAVDNLVKNGFLVGKNVIGHWIVDVAWVVAEMHLWFLHLEIWTELQLLKHLFSGVIEEHRLNECFISVYKRILELFTLVIIYFMVVTTFLMAVAKGYSGVVRYFCAVEILTYFEQFVFFSELFLKAFRLEKEGTAD